jgi:hypothetical protein
MPFGRRKQKDQKVKKRSERTPRKIDKRVKALEPTPGKKITVVVVILIVGLLIVAALLYFVIIPRTSLSIQTVYHERLGGGSTGGGININIRFTNDGTNKIMGIDMTLSVINQSDVQVIRFVDSVGQLERGESQEVRTEFIGNHLETYYMTLSVTFKSEGESFSKDFSYKTEEDIMNLDFRDTVKG